MIYHKNKYNAKRCRCFQSHNHDSRGEAAYCDQLQMMVKAGCIDSFQTQKRFDLHSVDGKKVASHYVDFLVRNFDGTDEVHEFKSSGTVTDLWKLKKALFEREYPKIPYIVVWAKNGWRNR